jgi:protein SCO1/2
MTLSKIHSALGKLSPTKREHVRVVFISVDHRADTPANTAKYARSIDPAFIGLTGSKEEMDLVTEKYGAAYRLKEKSPGSTDYTVEHSNQIFVIDQNGNLVDWLASGYEDEKLGAEVLELLQGA